MTESPSTRAAMIAAIGVLACVVYLAGGRLDIGTAALDIKFTPALAPAKQLAYATDAPNGHQLTPSTLLARASLSIARGRRTALRDLAAITTAATIIAFGLWMLAAGVDLFPVAIAMLAMTMGAASWARGVSWNGDALTPLLVAGALLATAHRRWIAAGILAIAAIYDGYQHAGVITSLSSEFSMLGLCLVAIGVLASVTGIRLRRIEVAAGGLVAIALYAVRLTDIPLVLAGWAACAYAIQWLQAAAPPRTARVLVTTVAVVLIAAPALARIRMSALGADLDSSLAARAAYDLRPADLPANAAMIAESRRVDSALRLQSIDIVPQTPASLDEAIRNGKTLAAFAGAQGNLEKLGFIFERAWAGNVPVAILAGRTPCIDLVDGEWRDVTPLTATGGFILHGPTYGSAPGGAVVKVTNTPLARVASIEPRSIPYEMTDGAGETTIRVPRTGREDAVSVALDLAPASASATADEGSPVTLCPAPLRGLPTLGRGATGVAQLRMDDNAAFISGWHPVEADPDMFRWTGAPESIVRVTMSSPDAVRITITATPASRPPLKASISLSVNACELGSRDMPQALTDYEWTAGAECWRAGVNQLTIRTAPLISPSSLFATHDTRLLGARIGAIRLARTQSR